MDYAFPRLKNVFTQAPVLHQANPTLPFVVETYASGIALGTVLSQRDPETGRLHPVAYQFRKLLLAEINYSIHNWELIAFKEALTTLRHYLQEARHPISVWTNQNNLQQLRAARCLTGRHAQSMELFSRDDFLFTYCPG